jgi:thiamine biosynthesis lipoprotein
MILAALVPALVLVLPALPRSTRQGAPDPTVERRLGAMGTWLELRVRGAERADALAASEAAVRAIEAAEARLSTWRDDSELARANRNAVGEPCALTAALAADLAAAERWWRASTGAFDPGLGALVDAWGLRSGGRQPSEEELARARAAGGFAAFTLDADARTLVRGHADARIEEGAFGKGVGLDAALAALAAGGATAAVIDLGGQLAVLGAPVTTPLAHPEDRARSVLELDVPPGSLATSGNSERGIVVAGERRAHLLDPRTGAPAADFGSLTVWAADATAADCLSTALYVLGPDAAFRWIAAHPGIELVVLLRPSEPGAPLRARASAGWRDRIRVLDPDLVLVMDGSSPPVAPSPR